VRAAKLARGLERMASQTSQNQVAAMLRKSPGLESPDVWRETIANHHQNGMAFHKQPALTRSIILKAPAANGEKGILLLTFEYNWALCYSRRI
jgi:hypothetical protein